MNKEHSTQSLWPKNPPIKLWLTIVRGKNKRKFVSFYFSSFCWWLFVVARFCLVFSFYFYYVLYSCFFFYWIFRDPTFVVCNSTVKYMSGLLLNNVVFCDINNVCCIIYIQYIYICITLIQNMFPSGNIFVIITYPYVCVSC